VTDWFVNRRLATAMGVFVSSYPLGTALALVVCPALAARGSWRAAMLLTAAAALACLVLVGAVYREPPGAPGRAAGGAAISLSRREAVLVSLAGLVWTAYNASYLVLVSFAPDLLTARGYSVTAAAMLVSIAGWICLPTGPVGGYVADRLGRPDLVLGGAFAVMTFGMGAFVALDVEVAAFVIVAVAFAVAPGLIMALPADVLRPVNRAAGMGLYYTWYYAGVATLPAVAGLARDASESRAAPILVAALLACLAAVCALAFRAAQRRPHPASGPQPVAGP
jgi:predicted MFS family arabinose efflux permease